ncbi:hypothetical protein [Arthrobacter antioxidans]|uniref:hypothetical protein n=1 Tax=Arthrobacter antioxidans TaxID=2895818 RepID=UPI001FFE93FE|nr:hypothetical protein [Arthrobacter antioxidans]
MIPDESATNPTSRNAGDTAVPDGAPGGPSRGRFLVMVLAVAFAGVGLVSLAAILATAFLQGIVWPGFVLASYFCLPIAFLLMVSLLIGSVLSRRNS